MTTAPAGLSGPMSAPALRVIDVAKAFGATQALRAASLELRQGEVHAIVGENGSGKSTLVKILSGVHRPDAGRLQFGERLLPALPTPRAAIAEGIATVFQEVLVVEPRSVLDNIWLGSDGLFRARVTDHQKRALAQETLAALLDRPPPLDLPVEALSISERQACSLARALVRDPRILILDEATSTLDVATRDRLFALLRRRAALGVAVIFISHRMDEISEIGDRATVMRSGETVATLERGQASTSELVRLMSGASHLAPDATRARAAARQPGAVVLSGRQLALRPGGAPFDVEVRAGELLGVAGLEGHGQEAFLQALWGARVFAGEVQCGEMPIRSSREAAAHGIGFVARERRADSLFESKSTRENFGMTTLQHDVRAWLLRPASTRERLAVYAERLGINLGPPDAPVTTLSGGNQQKVVIARWLATQPRVLLLNDPTRGIDLGAKRDLYKLLVELAAEGVAIVTLSSELDEHVELMDRVLVFREHELAAELPRARLSRRALLAAYFGEDSGNA